jgi:hypothetical protein
LNICNQFEYLNYPEDEGEEEDLIDDEEYEEDLVEDEVD